MIQYLFQDQKTAFNLKPKTAYVKNLKNYLNVSFPLQEKKSREMDTKHPPAPDNQLPHVLKDCSGKV